MQYLMKFKGIHLVDVYSDKTYTWVFVGRLNVARALNAVGRRKRSTLEALRKAYVKKQTRAIIVLLK